MLYVFHVAIFMTPHLTPDLQVGPSLDQDLDSESATFLTRTHQRGVAELQESIYSIKE